MTDGEAMRRALELAATARGRVSPRPPVGAVVLDASGEPAGEGATTPSPGPHAEIVALRAARDAARGGTMVVTLEPCPHTATTPPCSEALIAAGVRRVVAACVDPNPKARGRGLRVLRDAGIEVRTGPGRAAARSLIEPFARWVTAGRPLVTVKIAASLDGKVAAPDGTSRWITGEPARREVHEMRGFADAVLVGAGTVAADDPQLTSRTPGFDGPQPARVLVDSTGRTAPTARIFDGTAPAIVLTTEAAGRRADEWTSVGARVRVLPKAEAGIDLGAGLAALGEMEICDLLVEPGPTLASTLLAGGFADRIVLYLAPTVIGGDAPAMFADGVKTLPDAWRLRVTGLRRIGDDLRIDAIPEAG